LQSLKLASSNLLYNLGLGSSLPRKNFSDKYWRWSGPGCIEEIYNPILLSAIVEANNFKIGTQLWFGEYVTITTLVLNLVGAGGLKNCGYHVLHTMYPVPINSYRNVNRSSAIAERPRDAPCC